MLRFAFSLLLFNSGVTAATLERLYVDRLAERRTGKEVHELRKEFEDLKIARAACRLQIRQNKVPEACYETLGLETRWGLHPSERSRAKLRAELDEICRKAANELRVGRHSLNAVSPACRREIAKAREIQEYRDAGSGWSGN